MLGMKIRYDSVTNIDVPTYRFFSAQVLLKFAARLKLSPFATFAGAHGAHSGGLPRLACRRCAIATVHGLFAGHRGGWALSLCSGLSVSFVHHVLSFFFSNVEFARWVVLKSSDVTCHTFSCHLPVCRLSLRGMTSLTSFSTSSTTKPSPSMCSTPRPRPSGKSQ